MPPQYSSPFSALVSSFHCSCVDVCCCKSQSFALPSELWHHSKKEVTLLRVTPYESGTTRNRTGDTRIFSPLLYQLSYGTNCVNFACAKVRIIFESAKFYADFFKIICNREMQRCNILVYDGIKAKERVRLYSHILSFAFNYFSLSGFHPCALSSNS